MAATTDKFEVFQYNYEDLDHVLDNILKRKKPTIKSKDLDDIRKLLPSGSLTNLFIHGYFRHRFLRSKYKFEKKHVQLMSDIWRRRMVQKDFREKSGLGPGDAVDHEAFSALLQVVFSFLQGKSIKLDNLLMAIFVFNSDMNLIALPVKENNSKGDLEKKTLKLLKNCFLKRNALKTLQVQIREEFERKPELQGFVLHTLAPKLKELQRCLSTSTSICSIFDYLIQATLGPEEWGKWKDDGVNTFYRMLSTLKNHSTAEKIGAYLNKNLKLPKLAIECGIFPLCYINSYNLSESGICISSQYIREFEPHDRHLRLFVMLALGVHREEINLRDLFDGESIQD